MEEHFEEIAISNTLLEARSLAEKSLSLLSERNKLTKIADKHRWDTVNSYMTDPLAKDEVDDKKLHKAVKDAETTRERSKRERVVESRRSTPARAFGNTNSPLNPNRLGPIPSTMLDMPSRVVIPSTGKKYTQPLCYCRGKIEYISRVWLLKLIQNPD